MLDSAQQQSLVLGVPARGNVATGGGCGRDLAPGPGMATDEPALASEMKFTLQLQRFPSRHQSKRGVPRGFHFKTIIGKFGPETSSYLFLAIAA